MVCTKCIPSVHGSWKKALDNLELELLMVVSHHMKDKNKNQVLFKSSKYSSQPLRCPSNPRAGNNF